MICCTGRLKHVHCTKYRVFFFLNEKRNNNSQKKKEKNNRKSIKQNTNENNSNEKKNLYRKDEYLYLYGFSVVSLFIRTIKQKWMRKLAKYFIHTTIEMKLTDFSENPKLNNKRNKTASHSSWKMYVLRTTFLLYTTHTKRKPRSRDTPT